MRTILSRLQGYPRSLLIVLALGLVSRTLFVSMHQRPPISDEREYEILADHIARTASYAYDVVPTAYRPVGYPAFVGLIYALAGEHLLAVKYLQVLLDTGTGFILYLLLAGQSKRVRVIGAAAWSFFVPAVLYTNFLMTETVFTFLLVLAALVIVRWKEARGAVFFIIGLLLGILVLMKPSVILLLLALPLFYISRATTAAKKLFPVALGLFIVVGPWVYRNYRTFGTPAISSNGGVNLLIGNNPNSTGAYGISYDPAITQEAQNEFEVDHLATRYAIEYIVSNPGTFVVQSFRKVAHLFESEGGLLVWTFAPDPEATATRFSSKYSSLPLLLILLVNIPYFILMLCGVFGFLQAARDDLWWISVTILTTWVIVQAVFFGGSRFHFPLMPFVALYAAEFLADVEGNFKRLQIIYRDIGIGIGVLLLAVWTYEGIFIFHA